MSQAVPATSSLDFLIEYVGSRKGLFGGSKEFKDLADPFAAYLTELRATRENRDDVRIAAKTASARLNVEDVGWDFVVGQIGAVSKARPAPDVEAPFEKHFPDMKPGDAKSLGPGKAKIFGETLVGRLKTFAVATLAPFIAPLEAANMAITDAAAARTTAFVNAANLDGPRVLAVEKVNALIDVTEAQILQRKPGRHDLVRAYLSWKDDEPKKEDNGEPGPS